MTGVKLKLIYADDEPLLREVVALCLGDDPTIELVCAASGAEALDLCRLDPPDVLLLDVMMPGLDGPETLARLRADPGLAALPVVFVTGRTRPEEIARLRALGAVGHIAKPFDAGQLVERVRAILAAAGD